MFDVVLLQLQHYWGSPVDLLIDIFRFCLATCAWGALIFAVGAIIVGIASVVLMVVGYALFILFLPFSLAAWLLMMAWNTLCFAARVVRAVPHFTKKLVNYFSATKATADSQHDENTESNAENFATHKSLEATAFNVLGLPKGATKVQVINAYREKMKLNHPDKVAALDPEIRAFASERAKKINQAYEEALREVG